MVAVVCDYLRHHGNTNPNRLHPRSREAGQLLVAVREGFARFANADPAGVVFGANATSLTLHFACAFERELQPGDVILCTQLDHEANVAPWLASAERRGATVRFVPLDPATFKPELRSLEAAVDDRTRLIAFTRASNLTGPVVAPQPFVEAARAFGPLTYTDAVDSAAHLPLQQRELGIDIQICSPGVLRPSQGRACSATGDSRVANPESGASCADERPSTLGNGDALDPGRRRAARGPELHRNHRLHGDRKPQTPAHRPGATRNRRDPACAAPRGVGGVLAEETRGGRS
jgi:hypothetical protein